MECDRLERLVKSWYFQVQDEALAPARMVSFMNKHIDECPICLTDPVVKQEIQKIIEIVLPPSKTRKPTEGAAKQKEEEGAPQTQKTSAEHTANPEDDSDEEEYDDGNGDGDGDGDEEDEEY